MLRDIHQLSRAHGGREAIALGLALFGMTASAMAQASDTEEIAPEAPNTGRLHLSFGAEYTNDYYFRGIIQEDDAVMVQPWAEILIDAVRAEEYTLGFKVGTWHSFHDAATNAGTDDDFTEDWYEADWYLGPTLTVGELTFGAQYVWYTSPSDAFDTIEEVLLTAGFDDSEYLGDWALAPRLALAIETGDNFADGADTDSGVYLELGVTPGFDLEKTLIGDWRINVPLTVGLSLSDYYEDASGDDEAFGYFDIGVEAGTLLPIPAEWGAWSFTAGVHLLILGDHTRQYNTDEDHEFIASVGLSVSY
jgi:hypothetical protein